MKLVTFIFLFLASSLAGRSQTLNKNLLLSRFPSLFTSEFVNNGNDGYISEWIATLDSTDVFADLTQKNHLYLDYLLHNYTNFDRDKLKNVQNDSIKLLNTFRNLLKRDSTFNEQMLVLSYWYLKSKGIGVEGYNAQKIKITKRELMDIASKFFFATEIAPDSSVHWKVCVGMNYYAYDTLTRKNPQIEAFCFMTVMENYYNPKYPFRERFKENASEIESNLKSHPFKERLAIARKSMFDDMTQSEELEKALIETYRGKSEQLPFELTDVRN